jgi:peroxiredoxin
VKLRCLILTVCLAAGSCTDSGKTAGAGSASGEAAPEFQGKTLAGDYVQLSDFAGKVVLLNVWATWCKPCVKELPELARLSHAYPADDFVVVGVSVDTPNARGAVAHKVKQFGLDYPIVLDPNGRSLQAYDLRGYPTSFLIDREGKVRWRRDGLIQENDGELAAQIKAAL